MLSHKDYPLLYQPIIIALLLVLWNCMNLHRIDVMYKSPHSDAPYFAVLVILAVPSLVLHVVYYKLPARRWVLMQVLTAGAILFAYFAWLAYGVQC